MDSQLLNTKKRRKNSFNFGETVFENFLVPDQSGEQLLLFARNTHFENQNMKNVSFANLRSF